MSCGACGSSVTSVAGSRWLPPGGAAAHDGCGLGATPTIPRPSLPPSLPRTQAPPPTIHGRRKGGRPEAAGPGSKGHFSQMFGIKADAGRSQFLFLSLRGAHDSATLCATAGPASTTHLLHFPLLQPLALSQKAHKIIITGRKSLNSDSKILSVCSRGGGTMG